MRAHSSIRRAGRLCSRTLIRSSGLRSFSWATEDDPSNGGHISRSLADLDVIYVYLDGFALRVRSAGKVVSVPVLGMIGILSDGHKYLLALEPCGAESFATWKGCLDDLVARGLRAPVLSIIDG